MKADGMHIGNAFTRAVANKLLGRLLKKKLGVDASVFLDELDIVSLDEDTKFYIRGSVVVRNKDVKKLMGDDDGTNN